MSIYLVQHGLSLPKDIDPEKGLSEKGAADVNRIAEVAQGYGVQVSRIVHSGKKRARETARNICSPTAAGRRGDELRWNEASG